jgi:exopolysaccharide biosynthesis polyprenyl glycosylphosphotransferase
VALHLALGIDGWRRSLSGITLDARLLLHLPGIIGIWLTALALCGAYDRRYLALRGRSLSLTLLGSAAATAACAGALYLVPAWHMSRLAFVVLGMVAGVGLVLIRKVWLTRERGALLPHFLGVGDPELLSAVWMEFRTATGTDRRLSVVYPNGTPPSSPPESIRYCSEAQALEALDEHGPGVVVLSDGTVPSSQAAHILAQAGLGGSTVADIFTFHESYTGRAPIFRIGGRWVFRAQHRAPDCAAYVAKRVFDLVITLLLLPIAAPLVAVGAILVKFTSPGPVLFTQRRVGYRGREFHLFKLRTMRADAGEHRSELWSSRDARRVTPIGHWLRATAIDELPQLWNVLRGDLSLVGPRPERPELVEQLREVILPYMQRHVVPCGVTGWAQIHRGADIAFDDVIDKVRLDLYYARHFSPWFDIVIVLRTFHMLLAAAKPGPAAVFPLGNGTALARRAVGLVQGGSGG